MRGRGQCPSAQRTTTTSNATCTATFSEASSAHMGAKDAAWPAPCLTCVPLSLDLSLSLARTGLRRHLRGHRALLPALGSSLQLGTGTASLPLLPLLPLLLLLLQLFLRFMPSTPPELLPALLASTIFLSLSLSVQLFLRFMPSTPPELLAVLLASTIFLSLSLCLSVSVAQASCDATGRAAAPRFNLVL